MTSVFFFFIKVDFQHNPRKALGEEAERTKVDDVKKCNAPGIKIICFHGVRVIGGNPCIFGEVDLCCFIFYQDRFFILILEVKCNEIIRKSGGTRKKAKTQLNTCIEMLRDELNVPTDKLQHHVVWPQMDPLEQCKICQGSQPSLYEKPMACNQP